MSEDFGFKQAEALQTEEPVQGIPMNNTQKDSEEVNADPSAAAEATAAEDHGLGAGDEPAKAPGKHPLLEEDYTLLLLRLFNGEWILGQFKVEKNEAGNPFILYHKVYSFQTGVDNTGKRVVQMRPWPADKGEIELNQISGKGYTDTSYDDGFSFEDAYIQAISPIARASAQAQQAATAKAAAELNARRILTPGGR